MLTLPELERVSESIRESNRTLVLTNGCFDLLHVGHIRYLIAARELGDVLVVGLNSDSSVRRIKGEGRPLTPEDERAEILAALQCVDFVSIFAGDTAAELVALAKPAVYVKGGDYSPSPDDPAFPPEGRLVRAYGGEVKILPFVAGHSTSALLTQLAAQARRAR